MSEIKTDAYLPSAGEYDTYFKKFRAFMSANLSKKAKNAGASESSTYENKGWYFLRTALAGSSDRVYYGYSGGTRGWHFTSLNYAGLRVAFQLIYNPECNLVRGCKTEKRETLVYEEKNGGPVYEGNGTNKKIKSEAPIIVYGGKKCIWLNKEECENGTDRTMKCWTLDLIDKAMPFDRDGNHNDFAKATELLNQCGKELKEGCTEEELDMLVTVVMNKEDGYEKCEPILEEKKENEEKKELTVEGLFADLFEGKISEEDLRTGLKEISKLERNKPNATEETAKALEGKIAEEAKLLEEKLADKTKVNKAFDMLDSSIDNLQLGGK